MIPQAPDLSLAANLRRLATLLKEWPGALLDTAGTVRLLHEGGRAVPVFWCFNAVSEYERLGAALGADRPLAGMRSLNQIVTPTPDTTFAIEALALHYAQTLFARFGTQPCIVGGNCQAAGIAWRVACHLRAAGVPVERLALLDADLHMPYPGPVRLMFGARSDRYNPYLVTPPDPQRAPPWHWQRAWRVFDVCIVRGAHGEYFEPANVPEVARAIVAPFDPDAETAPPRPLTLARCRIATIGPTGTTVVVEAASASRSLTDLRGLCVVPVWIDDLGGVQRVAGPDWVVPVTTRPVWRHLFAPPPGGRDLRLVPVLCRAAHGPLHWPDLWPGASLVTDEKPA